MLLSKKYLMLLTIELKIEYVYQPVNVKIEGLKLVKRTKPWGTSHAVLVAKDAINEPFAVINADDYYGTNSFKIMADFLAKDCSETKMSMIGYILENTLSKKMGLEECVMLMKI